LENNNKSEILLRAEGISKSFVTSRRESLFARKRLRALQDVSLSISKGEKIGLIGRSGSGKSTLIRCLAKLIEPDSGKIFFRGKDIARIPAREFRHQRNSLQIIFQNNYSALNPGMRVSQMLRETARLGGHSDGIEEVIAAQMRKVSLSETLLERYPRELSGGECRRIGVAMVDLIGPELLLADEPVTALDYINKWEMLALFKQLNERKGTALLFATHDLEAMIDFVTRVIVLFGGTLVESFPISSLWETRHPHTVELVRYYGFLKNKFTDNDLAPYNVENKGRISNLEKNGCIFAHQCQRFRILGNPDICIDEKPSLVQIDNDHFVACHFSGKVVE
jgi:ABC-type glutathione transport system ATPase component